MKENLESWEDILKALGDVFAAAARKLGVEFKWESIASEVNSGQPEGSPAEAVEGLIGVHEVARRLSVCDNTVIKWTKQGRIPVLRIGRRMWFRWAAVVAALEAVGRGREEDGNEGAAAPSPE